MTTYSPGLGTSGGGGASEVNLKNEVGTVINPATLELQTQLLSLTETLQELNSRLMVLASMANAGQPALRVIPIASVATAVSGSLTTVTSVGSLTNIGTVPANVVAWSQQNLLVTQANINNASA